MFRNCAVLLTILGLALALPSTSQARTPSEAKVAKDVTAHWNKQWPDQQVAHVSRKSEKCEQAEIELKNKRGKVKKTKTCLLMTDVYIERGYRLFIYRGTEAHFRGRKLVSVQLGELQKAWKAGGVPAPTQEQTLALLGPKAVELLGADAALTIKEVGRPRPYGDFYRFSVILDASFTKDGQAQKRQGVLATLQSDGGEWQVVPELLF